MDKKHVEQDEYLEKLWEMKEHGEVHMSALVQGLHGTFDIGIVEELVAGDLVVLSDETREISLTAKGEDQARKIIRAHRIGERLLYDVFGGEFEAGACEFEHMRSLEIVDGICTLLGHPRECPHGMPIPDGECCRRSAKTTQNMVVPLAEVAIGQSVRVAYINCRDDGQIHRLEGLQIRPGAVIKLHQRYPCCVVECESASIALDDEILDSICVWDNTPQSHPDTDVSAPVLPVSRQKWLRSLCFWKRNNQLR